MSVFRFRENEIQDPAVADAFKELAVILDNIEREKGLILDLIRVSGTAAVLEIEETDQVTDEKIWRIDSFGSDLRITTRTDAGGVGNDLLKAPRTGTVIDDVRLLPAFKMLERAAAASDTSTYGQLFVKNTTPQQLWFRDEAGAETQLV